jgi:hypothetical protein
VSTNHAWFTGPAFLSLPQVDWPRGIDNDVCDVEDGDPEIKKSVKITATEITPEAVEDDPILKMTSNLSDWFTMKSRIATVIAMLENRGQKSRVKVTVEHLQKAEIKILSRVQSRHFKEEIKVLLEGKDLNQNSPIIKLKPFLDKSGIIRVGGRIEAVSVEWNIKHPIVLPKFDKTTDAIIGRKTEKR